MNSGRFTKGVRTAAKSIGATSLAMVLGGAVALAPVTAAATPAKSGEENRVVSQRAVDRAEIENLQRWVAAGHEDWCKDARLVAAEELKRIAADYAGDTQELGAVEVTETAGTANSARKVAFEWTPLDGRATYRVTVERFEWLLPIAQATDAVVWVPTMAEIQIHE